MRALVFFVILLSVDHISPAPRHEWFVVWNVGQGLWTTRVGGEGCDHFDAGGERRPIQSVGRLCPASVRQRFFFSHADWDHIGGLGQARRFAGACLAAAPGGELKNPRSRRLFAGFQTCAPSPATQEIHWTPRGKDSNSLSRVFLREDVLLPGDSPATEERLWAPRLPAPAPRILVLGHHGSRTSTSELLLNHLPHARMAVASARAAKYGHPHREVVQRLRRHRIALLKTEDWGSLIFERPVENRPPTK